MLAVYACFFMLVKQHDPCIRTVDVSLCTRPGSPTLGRGVGTPLKPETHLGSTPETLCETCRLQYCAELYMCM